MTNDLEARVDALETAVGRLEERAELEAASRSRALWIRVALNVVVVIAYVFVMRNAMSII